MTFSGDCTNVDSSKLYWSFILSPFFYPSSPISSCCSNSCSRFSLSVFNSSYLLFFMAKLMTSLLMIMMRTRCSKTSMK